MSAAAALKIFVDFAMLACFLFLFALPATGVFTHEVLGSFLFVLFLLHNALNYRWYKALFKGRYGAERISRTSVNAALKNLPRLAGFCLRGAFFLFGSLRHKSVFCRGNFCDTGFLLYLFLQRSGTRIKLFLFDVFLSDLLLCVFGICCFVFDGKNSTQKT